ncbi:MAG: hypothetical protein HOE69_07670 [Euryarchaeota archaeon]|jgi:predicted  nucleic acid-binding Zn-ribbon protein|nr:hypothetical protein [Euryarchaeota archaeon]
MSDEERVFLVIRCKECERHFGSLTQVPSSQCPGCGTRGENPIVERANDSEDLREKVSLANTPPELRAELNKRMRRDNYESFEEDTKSPRALLKIISNIVDENGLINLQIVQNALDKRQIESPNGQELIDMVESQGLLLRHSSDEWRWLG